MNKTKGEIKTPVEFERFNRVVEKGKYEESYMFKLDNERIYIDFVFVDRELKEIVSNKNFEEVKGLLGEIFKKYWKGDRFADITEETI